MDRNDFLKFIKVTFLILHHFPVVFSPLWVSPWGLPVVSSSLYLPVLGSKSSGRAFRHLHAFTIIHSDVCEHLQKRQAFDTQSQTYQKNPKNKFLESSQEGLLKNRRPSNNRISLKNRTVFFCRPGMSLKKYSFLKTSCPELFRLNSQEDPRKAS